MLWTEERSSEGKAHLFAHVATSEVGGEGGGSAHALLREVVDDTVVLQYRTRAVSNVAKRHCKPFLAPSDLQTAVKARKVAEVDFPQHKTHQDPVSFA
eukprot:3932190-Rhodomonas_salina.3